MIIQTGMRTDIPAFYSEWLVNRIKDANADAALVKENMRRHDSTSPFLLGRSMPGDVIHEAKQRSWFDGQMRLDIF